MRGFLSTDCCVQILNEGSPLTQRLDHDLHEDFRLPSYEEGEEKYLLFLGNKQTENMSSIMCAGKQAVNPDIS